uniref:Uncharacterized protein n=1 Tax=Oryza sativa subsp. japonica TaxID=39947 RepID=Q84YW3_ORYSJ|nr:hypothetical protein [Oryza sativa Japonica Group]
MAQNHPVAQWKTIDLIRCKSARQLHLAMTPVIPAWSQEATRLLFSKKISVLFTPSYNELTSFYLGVRGLLGIATDPYFLKIEHEAHVRVGVPETSSHTYRGGLPYLATTLLPPEGLHLHAGHLRRRQVTSSPRSNRAVSLK